MSYEISVALSGLPHVTRPGEVELRFDDETGYEERIQWPNTVLVFGRVLELSPCGGFGFCNVSCNGTLGAEMREWAKAHSLTLTSEG